jgi:hypothetical protein
MAIGISISIPAANRNPCDTSSPLTLPARYWLSSDRSINPATVPALLLPLPHVRRWHTPYMSTIPTVKIAGTPRSRAGQDGVRTGHARPVRVRLVDVATVRAPPVLHLARHVLIMHTRGPRYTHSHAADGIRPGTVQMTLASPSDVGHTGPCRYFPTGSKAARCGGCAAPRMRRWRAGHGAHPSGTTTAAQEATGGGGPRPSCCLWLVTTGVRVPTRARPVLVGLQPGRVKQR